MQIARRVIIVSILGFSWGFVGVTGLHAQVLFQDDFELATVGADGLITSWDGPHDSSSMYPTNQMSHSGRRSLELQYIPGSNGASFMYRPILGRNQIYVRWYQRWSPGFVWEPSSTKMVILRPWGGYPQFYPEVLWANGQLAIQAQVIEEANWDSKNFYQNQGDPLVFGTDRWYGIEVFVKLNTPGVADGELAAWIDGELKLLYTGRAFRGSSPLDPAPSIATIQAVGMSGYYGGVTTVPQLQFSWQDDVVISESPIGYQFLSDDFETNTTNADGGISRWDGPSKPSAMYLTDQMSNSGARSLELMYAPGSSGAGYMYDYFPPQDQIYVRWYQRWSANFLWEPSSTSLLGLRPSSGFPQFYPFVMGASGQMAIQAQVIADRGWDVENLFQNLGDPVIFGPDRWYCVEVFIKLNTPGVADGVVAAWIDGEPKLLHAGRRLRGVSPTDPAPSTARIKQLFVAAQYGGLAPVPYLQFSWQDDYVASTERIGCQPYAPIFP